MGTHLNRDSLVVGAVGVEEQSGELLAYRWWVDGETNEQMLQWNNLVELDKFDVFHEAQQLYERSSHLQGRVVNAIRQFR